MKMKVVAVSAALALGLAASYSPADPTKVDVPFGIFQQDSTCPDATHSLRDTCGTSAISAYLSLKRSSHAELSRFLGQNVAVRGTIVASSCAKPVVEVSRIALSTVFPPCPPPPGP